MDRSEFRSLFRKYRLPRTTFQGLGTAFFTLCVDQRYPALRGAVADYCIAVLKDTLPRHATRADIFCFMPDHVHILATGMLESADAWQAIVEFKQHTGYWFWKKRMGFRWQKGFDARPMQPYRSLDEVAAYIANNPVRKGLVEDCRDYLYTGRTDWEPWRYNV
jgi:REP element-mobilizing transposase RayT